jgi:hypothetical protein
MARAMPWLLPVLFLLLPGAGAAQTVRPDSVIQLPLVDSSVVVGAQDTAHLVVPPGKSPGLAMLFSAVLPGAGQAYNESYWKVPIVLGLGMYFVSEWLDNNRRTVDYRDKYAASLQTSGGDERSLRLREFYKNQRDSFAWYFLILYFVNIADAYVDASLSGFDVSPTLGHRDFPAAGLALRFTW